MNLHTKQNNVINNEIMNQNVNDYFVSLCDKISINLVPTKRLEKIDNENIYIPKYDEYYFLLKYNYNIQQLKIFSKTYKLKVTGNKQQLVSRIYSFLLLSNSIIKIQKIFRGYIQRKYNNLHGPAFMNRSLCSNTYDFLSMDELKDVSNDQFFSYKDLDGFIYGFDLLSLYNLIYKSNGVIKNPFNTKTISSDVIEKFKTFIRLSKVLCINICTEVNDLTNELSNKKMIELRALTLFQNIDALGNYSNSSWFMTLNRLQLIKFLRELVDIWQYRAPLSIETKKAICPPLGNPFTRVVNYNYLQVVENIDEIRKYILEIMEKMATTGIDKDSKCLGAYYILGALTLVNNDAATSLPWLFQAVSYM